MWRIWIINDLSYNTNNLNGVFSGEMEGETGWDVSIRGKTKPTTTCSTFPSNSTTFTDSQSNEKIGWEKQEEFTLSWWQSFSKIDYSFKEKEQKQITNPG